MEYRLHGRHAYSQVYFVSETTLAASGESGRRATQDPAGTAAFIRAQHAKDLKTDYLEASPRLIVPLLTAKQPAFGAMTPATWNAQFAALLKTRPGLTLPAMSTSAAFSLIPSPTTPCLRKRRTRPHPLAQAMLSHDSRET